jgi:hypothetical protein
MNDSSFPTVLTIVESRPSIVISAPINKYITLYEIIISNKYDHPSSIIYRLTAIHNLYINDKSESMEITT